MVKGKSVDVILMVLALLGQMVEKGEPVDVYISGTGPSVTKPWWGTLFRLDWTMHVLA